MPNNLLSRLFGLPRKLYEGVALYRDKKFYVKVLPELLKEHNGEYALIQGARVHGFFGGYSEAVNQGYTRFKTKPFLAQEIHPHVILLDIMMPKMNGLETLKVIKSNQKLKNIPVVILTNLGDRQEDTQKCKELGAEDYWVKANMSLGEIVNKVRKIVAEKK